MIINGINAYTDWGQCHGDSCQDPDIELLLSTLEKSAGSILGTENGFMEAIRDVEHLTNRMGYIYPPLTRIQPEYIGAKVDIDLLPGHVTQRITRSVSPPLFEIPDFLSSAECEELIKIGKKKGLRLRKETDGEGDQETVPFEQTTLLGPSDFKEDFFQSAVERITAVTQLPVDVISRSDVPQLGLYHPGGQFSADYDTTMDEDTGNLPCCFQAHHCSKQTQVASEYTQCCRECNYLTVLIYLNDVEKGGETVFSFAEQPDQYMENLLSEKMNAGRQLHLSPEECAASKVKITPKRGTAIFWYNHFQDEKSGYLGPADQRSYHGGCEIKEGIKWTLRFTISGAYFDQRREPSRYERH